MLISTNTMKHQKNRNQSKVKSNEHDTDPAQTKIAAEILLQKKITVTSNSSSCSTGDIHTGIVVVVVVVVLSFLLVVTVGKVPG